MLHLSENTIAALSELEQKDTVSGNNMKNKGIEISVIEVNYDFA